MTLKLVAGTFLPSEGDTCFRSLDGEDIAEYLIKHGYLVIRHFDTGSNGLAITACGFAVSSNGWISKVKKHPYT